MVVTYVTSCSASAIIVAASLGCVFATILLVVLVRSYLILHKKKQYERNWIVKFDDIQYPRDVQDWLRRRYTLIDDGAGGLAVADAVRTARRNIKGQGYNAFEGTVEPAPREARMSVKKFITRTQGVYHKLPVTIKNCQKQLVYVTKHVLKEVRLVQRMKRNDNIIKFVGASVEWQKVAILYEYCAKGNLQVRTITKKCCHIQDIGVFSRIYYRAHSSSWIGLCGFLS